MSGTDKAERPMEEATHFDVDPHNWNAVLEALGNLYLSYLTYGENDGMVLYDLKALMEAYNDWLG